MTAAGDAVRGIRGKRGKLMWALADLGRSMAERDRLKREVSAAGAKVPEWLPRRHVNEAEADFLVALAAKYPNARARRDGWPDFLVIREGGSFCVEVKNGNDAVRPNQRATFEALESAGLQVFVWNPKRPDKLTPWAKYEVPMRKKRIRKLGLLQRPPKTVRHQV